MRVMPAVGTISLFPTRLAFPDPSALPSPCPVAESWAESRTAARRWDTAGQRQTAVRDIKHDRARRNLGRDIFRGRAWINRQIGKLYFIMSSLGETSIPCERDSPSHPLPADRNSEPAFVSIQPDPNKKASSLAVNGAVLAFSCLGSGPLLVVVPGANGDAVIFDKVAPVLARNFTVCTYDRRGFSRSTLDGAQELAMPARLHTDADDLAALIAHLSPSRPALVFGTSSGAIVSLDLLSRHPGAVDFLVAHEPPLTGALGGGEQVQAVFASVADVYVAQGAAAATRAFVGPLDEGDAESVAAHDVLESPGRAANADLFFRHEINDYTGVDLPLGPLRAARGKLLFADGVASGPPATTMTENLAESIGVGVEKTPAGHLGYVAEPEEWGARLAEIFEAHGKL
ncbi:hypothetical protein RB595_008574 [Gaeumannomyces hyphopodioides]